MAMSGHRKAWARADRLHWEMLERVTPYVHPEIREAWLRSVEHPVLTVNPVGFTNPLLPPFRGQEKLPPALRNAVPEGNTFIN